MHKGEETLYIHVQPVHMHCTCTLANSTVHVCIKNLFIINLPVAYVISILLELCLLNMIHYVNFTMNQVGHMIHTVYIALALRAKCLWIWERLAVLYMYCSSVGCAYGFLINPEPCNPYRFCSRYNKHRPADTNITESKSNENRRFYRILCLPVYA